MSAELAIVIKASAIVGAAQTAVSALGGSIGQLGRVTQTLTQTHATLARQMSTGFNQPTAAADRLRTHYDALGKSIDILNRKKSTLEALHNKREDLKKRSESLRGDIAGAVSAAGSILLPVKLAIDFESSMADVKKVVNFDTPQQFAEMNRDVLKLTRSIPMAGTEIAAIVAAGGQSGVARENLTGFATDAAKMGIAFDMAAGDAGKSMATLSNVLGVPIPAIGRLGDAINYLSDNANSDAAGIVNVLTRVGSNTRQLGLLENQAAALGSTFLSMGKPPELAAQAITGMTTAFSLAKVGKFDKELGQLGLTTKAFAAAMDKDAQGAISDFLGRVNKLPKKDQYPFLLDIFGKNYADDVLLLSSNVAEYNRQLDLLGETGKDGKLKYIDSMTREFNNRSSTSGNQLKILKNGLTEIGIVVGSQLLPPLNDLLQGTVIPLAHAFANWLQVNPGLAKTLVYAGTALAGFKIGSFAAKGAILLFQRGMIDTQIKVTELASAWVQAKGVWHASRAVMMLSNTQLLRQRGLVGGTARSLAHASRWYRNTNQSMLDWMINGGRRTKAFLTGLPAQVGKATTALKGLHLPRFKLGGKLGGFKFAMPSLSGMFESVKGLVQATFSVQNFARILPAIQTGLRGVAMGMRALAFNPLGLLIAALVVGAVLIYKYWHPIKAFFGGFWDGLKSGMASAQPAFTAIGAAFSGLWQKIAPFVRPIIDWFKDFFSITQVGEGGARSFGQTVGQFIGGTIGAVVGFVANRIGEMQAAFNGGLSGIIGLIINWSPIGAFYSAFAAVMSWFGIELPAKFTGFGSMIINGLVNSITGGTSRVVAAISGMASSAINTAKSIFGIHSPSRVFMGIGGFVTEGLDIGLTRGGLRPLATIGSLASHLQQRFTNRAGELRSNLSARMQANSAELAAARAQQQSAQTAQYGGHTIHYSPQIHAPGGDPNVINGLLKLSQREFETMLERYFADKARRAY